ncbi:hypothetical protein VPNG_05828 [Cytospora leucostoma]|uniref:2EXR domain-containing protein n=1 Tax=Cytospora leucostoma TaxID=1230097 RepID=A0A423X0L4_9PEZI|nr:hypothetical protein VPNG_05828 [Cytospora leucostoma]
MSDPQNAGYRLLSFKYKPTQTDRGVKQQDGEKEKAGNPAAPETELPSLAPLMTALEEVQETKSPLDKDDNATPQPDVGGTTTSTDNNTPITQPASAPASRPTPPATFHPFCDLPAELRIKIWHLTLLPRVVELHPTRPNYSVIHDDPGRPPQWQSGCSNPAALSVSTEARDIALEHYRIAFPLAAITTEQVPTPFARYAGDTGTYNFSGASVNGKALILRRVLYVSPVYDTVALLGQDSDFAKLSQLLNVFREADPMGVGISRLALSVRGWGYGGSATMMKSLERTILKDLEQLTLFMYGERDPPAEWRAKGAALDEALLEEFRRTGNRCEMLPCEGGSAWYAWRVWSGGKGRQFWDKDGRILRVGRNEMQIMDLEFKDGW